jgi:hypothetical protein
MNFTKGSIKEAKKYAIIKGKIYFHIRANRNIRKITRIILKIANSVPFTLSDIYAPYVL